MPTRQCVNLYKQTRRRSSDCSPSPAVSSVTPV